MKIFAAREITIIAITVSLTVVFGWLFYLTANLLPLPGSRFVGVTAFSSFMIYFPVVDKIRRQGVFLGVAAVFAGIMSLISLFMGLAIVLAGLLTEFAGWLVIKDYRSWRLIAVTGFFGFSGTLVSLFIFFIIGRTAFEVRKMLVPLILLTLIAFLGGCLGAYLADHIISRYLKQVKFWNH